MICEMKKEKKINEDCFRCKNLKILEPIEKSTPLVRFRCCKHRFETSNYNYNSRRIVDEYINAYGSW